MTLAKNQNQRSFKNINTIKQCFQIILQEDKEKSRLAARQVRKLLYRSKTRNVFVDIKKLVKNAPIEYGKITEDWRQENFVMAVSVIYFLRDLEDQPDFFFPWLFKLLLHPNGSIRYASVRMFECELGPLTVYIRVPDYKPDSRDHVKPEQAEDIIFSLFVDLHKLLEKVWEPKYKRYKYVDSLPTGPYKSIQMVLARIEELCGKEYMDNLAKMYQQLNDPTFMTGLIN